MWWITVGCLLVKGICSHLKVTRALMDIWQASEISHSKSSLGNFQHWYLLELLANICSYHLMKSVSWCCVHGRWIFQVWSHIHMQCIPHTTHTHMHTLQIQTHTNMYIHTTQQLLHIYIHTLDLMHNSYIYMYSYCTYAHRHYIYVVLPWTVKVAYLDLTLLPHSFVTVQ